MVQIPKGKLSILDVIYENVARNSEKVAAVWLDDNGDESVILSWR